MGHRATCIPGTRTNVGVDGKLDAKVWMPFSILKAVYGDKTLPKLTELLIIGFLSNPRMEHKHGQVTSEKKMKLKSKTKTSQRSMRGGASEH